ncbi:hypothetical protein [Candidatus Nitrosocosmicus franklandus]|uniref:Uncharacterized protein n=1 Tax=Candidatus Nitrosocosmicus franklandianus TaxID=1798806 RepID=A0A484I6M2_9ARCH|nr:hypothetical protein [Candidatus Nitrosocosmicus franklandus]VFJ12830.1 conserved protein of unknown function [Candidatus Nitrosocosmicus franklandus]
MDEFSRLLEDLKNNIAINKEFFKTTVIKNPSLVYYKLNELSKFVGSRYDVDLEIHFPTQKKIYDIDNYGTENLSIIIDKFRKAFPISRSSIKEEANKTFGSNIVVVDAYMYEGKEGVRIKFPNTGNGGGGGNEAPSSRIEILPGSFHLWTSLDDKIVQFCNWLMLNVYHNRSKK